ncbi:MAG: family 20 glycosylhydrolase [Saprospiraceae bacterium]|nr:family 20 glycosylhydrolase [Saprospiraceae bacterium]
MPKFDFFLHRQFTLQAKTPANEMLIRILTLLLTFPVISACQPAPSIDIIPKPASVEAADGAFILNKDTKIYSPSGNDDWSTVAEYLMLTFKASTGFQPISQFYNKKINKPGSNGIYLLRDPKMTHPEAYELEVRTGHVIIRSSSAAGAFYGVQTLLQLFPAEIGSPRAVNKPNGWVAPACTVRDQPRFSYRGMHLDVGRHFFPVSFVKKFIDLLAVHKLNVFHWHLTEDQGWRIEIKKYPKLQTIAACRNETLSGHYSDEPQKYDGLKYCGYYTQEEVKEVVSYAQKRFITIIPEIEMPGHALAALSAYPELGCIGGPYEAAKKWGVFDDVFCAGNEATFSFLEGVLEEVIPLFPGKYVHIGGDECPKTRWDNCAKCQKRMHDEKLKDAHELQSYFIRRAEKMLTKHGKALIGWDEILEGGLAPNATVMSWRGTEGGIAAARAGHDAIMTPTSHVYFDYYQSDPATEPLAIGGFLPLEKVYEYDPVPADFDAKEAQHILGVQGNIWTEYIKTSDKVEFMAFPRACALAEIAWTASSQKDFNDFSRRLLTHFNRLEARNVNYSKAIYDLSASFSKGKIALKGNLPDLEIRYTTNGTDPTGLANKYTEPFEIKQSTTVKSAAFKNGRPLGKVRTVKYLVHKASGKPYTMPRTPDKYTGGEQYALTNGVVGVMKAWNNWVALVNHDIDPVIDFGATTRFEKVTTHFVNSKVSWIYPPRSVAVYVSDDGVNFHKLAEKVIDADAMQGISVETVMLDTPGAQGRYLKLVATTFGVIPANAPGAGNGAWLFLDEVVVE